MRKKKPEKKKTAEQEREWEIRYHCDTIVHALKIAAKQYEIFETMLDDTLSGPGGVSTRSQEVRRLAEWLEKEFPVLTDSDIGE